MFYRHLHRFYTIVVVPAALLFMLGYHSATAQPTAQWSLRAPAQTVYITSTASTDSGSVTIGYLPFIPIPGLVFKTDSRGVVQWTKVLTRENGSVSLESLSISPDGSILISGNLSDEIVSSQPVFICLNADGSLRWSSIYTATFTGTFTSHCRTSDGGYALVGRMYFESDPDVNLGGFLIKTDSLGTPLWARKAAYQTATGPNFDAITEAPDGSLLIAGYVIAGSQTHTGLYRIASDGKLLANNLYHQSGRNIRLTKITSLTNGSYYAAGLTALTGTNTAPLFVHYDNSCTIDRAASYLMTSASSLTDLIPVEDNTLIGIFSSQNNNNNPIRVCKIDSDGTILTAIELTGRISEQAKICRLPSEPPSYLIASREMNDASSDRINISTLTLDLQACNAAALLITHGTVVLANTPLQPSYGSISVAKQTVEITVTKTVMDSLQICNGNLGKVAEAGSSDVQIYPNPSSAGTGIIVSLGSGIPKNRTIILRDLTGRELYRTAREAATSGEQIQIPTAGLSAGMYMIEVLDASSFANIWRGKVVVE